MLVLNNKFNYNINNFKKILNYNNLILLKIYLNKK